MKRSKMYTNRSVWGSGLHKGRPAVDHIARVPLEIPDSELNYQRPIGALLWATYYNRRNEKRRCAFKTVPLYMAKELIRRNEISTICTGDEWALYNELYPRP